VRVHGKGTREGGEKAGDGKNNKNVTESGQRSRLL